MRYSAASTNSLDCSPPPTTSQRYHRAPSSQAFSDGRNHAQLTTVRITRDSSAPRNFSKLSAAGLVGELAEVSSSYVRVLERVRQRADRERLGGVLLGAVDRSSWRCSARRRPRASRSRQAPSSGCSTESTCFGSTSGSLVAAAPAAASERDGGRQRGGAQQRSSVHGWSSGLGSAIVPAGGAASGSVGEQCGQRPAQLVRRLQLRLAPRRRAPRARRRTASSRALRRSTAPSGPRRSCRSGRARRARTAGPSSRPRTRRRRRSGRRAPPTCEERRVEEVLERPGHVAEVRGRAEQVAVRGQHVVRGRLQRGPDDHLDALDRVVVRAGHHRVGQGPQRPGGGVVDDEQDGHGREASERTLRLGGRHDAPAPSPSLPQRGLTRPDPLAAESVLRRRLPSTWRGPFHDPPEQHPQRPAAPAACRSSATAPSRRSTCPTAPGPTKTITEAPRWLSTDLRDGNQALIDPMTPARKLKMFELLVRMGYKEIEVGFPSACQTDFDFVRQLIESDRIPDDVTISVLTQAREDLIERTVQSLVGVPRANIHLYNALAPLFRRVVFHAGKDEIKDIAVRGTELVMKYSESYLGQTVIGYEYCPEIFTSTELPFSVEVCEAVSDVWQPEDGREIILNLPATVEIGHAQRLRRPDRVVLAPADPPRAHRDLAAPAQRPGYRGRGDRAGDDGRRGPRRGLPVRPRRAHRQRLPGDPGHEPVQPGHRPDDRLLRHRRDPPHGGVLHPAARPPAAPLRGRPRLHRLLRLPPGRDQEGSGGPRPAGPRAGRAGRASCRGRRRTSRSTRRTSAAPTRRSSGSTASPARAASPTSSRPSTSSTCRAARRSSSAGSSRSTPTRRAARWPPT